MKKHLKTRAIDRYIPWPGHTFKAYVIANVVYPKKDGNRYRGKKLETKYFGHECRNGICTCTERKDHYVNATDGEDNRIFDMHDFFFVQVKK